jgi:IS30 family transposase
MILVRTNQQGKHMAYHQVDRTERRHIHRLRQAGKSNVEIAEFVGRHPSTVGREILRNSGGRGYRPKQAQEKADGRSRGPQYRKLDGAMADRISTSVRAGSTPEQIAGRARLEGVPMVCGERIYQHIYADAKLGGDLYRHLPRSGRKRKRRCPHADRRGRIRNQTMIDARPPETETRDGAGHWEGDLVVGEGNSGCLVTLVERRTLLTLVGKTSGKHAADVTAEIVRLLLSVPGLPLLSLTLDNGKEFAFHGQVASVVSLAVFFAHPYHSWERGTNENTNGLIRRVYPKGTRFDGIGRPETGALMALLNARPRACLSFLTPGEAMAREVARNPPPGERPPSPGVLGAAPVASAGAPVLEKPPRPRLNIRTGFATLTDNEKQRFLTPIYSQSGNSRSVALET